MNQKQRPFRGSRTAPPGSAEERRDLGRTHRIYRALLGQKIPRQTQAHRIHGRRGKNISIPDQQLQPYVSCRERPFIRRKLYRLCNVHPKPQKIKLKCTFRMLSGLLTSCVSRHHFEFNISLKFCFRLYYTVLSGKKQEGGMAKSHKIVRFQAAAVLYCRFFIDRQTGQRGKIRGPRLFGLQKKTKSARKWSLND